METVVQELREAAGRSWIEPHVSQEVDGCAVLEWWFGTRKITIYVGEELHILCIEGARIEEGVWDPAALWAWLAAQSGLS